MESFYVGSGWYSPEFCSPGRRVGGDDFIRSPEFHRLWLDSVLESLQPDKVVIVDSASPRFSPLVGHADVSWIRLPTNPGHSADFIGFLSGWSWSVVLTLLDFLNSEEDYYCYVEQDCLVRPDFRPHCRAVLTAECGRGILLGSGEGTPQPIQQSFFVVHRATAHRFLARFLSLSDSDRRVVPEVKFLLAASRVPLIFANSGVGALQRFAVRAATRFPGHRLLPMQGGRARPLTTETKYLQHATRAELAEFLDRSWEAVLQDVGLVDED